MGANQVLWKRFFSLLTAALVVSLCGPAARANTATHSDWAWHNVERIIVIPDIHGAHPAFVELLKSTGIITDGLTWAGGTAHLVSLGDILDRGPQSRDAMDLLMRLQREARAAGGRVHVVAGNHELMNLTGDLRYVAREEFAAFAADETGAMRDSAYREFLADSEETFVSDEASRQRFDERYPRGYFAHRQAFSTDGTYGAWLLSLPAVITVNDVAFAHGGLPPMMTTMSLDQVNHMYRHTVKRYLELWQELVSVGALPDDQSQDAGALAKSVMQNAQLSGCVQERMEACEQLQEQSDSELAALHPDTFAKLEEFIELSDAAVLNDDGPLWYRRAVLCRPVLERPVLDAALANLGARKAVVGHTTSPDKRVHSMHDGQLITLDTGMLVSYYSGRPAALVLQGDSEIVHYLSPSEQVSPERSRYPHAYGLSRGALEQLLSSGTIETVHKANGVAASQVQISHNGVTVQAQHFAQARGGAQELAAYALDRLLGFELVPVTVAREVDDRNGALQLRYTDAISEAQRSQQGIGISGWCPMEQQLQLMYAFDLLIANTGRSVDNVNFRQRTWELFQTSHRRAFTNGRKLPRGLRAEAITLTPGMRNALLDLNEDNLQEALGQWLNRKAIRALLSRRNAMLKLFAE
ncbi:MAG: hypothetical protein HKN70_14050 [Gammaproteobacteria bacterium]|nr:hypothetical protein [Gammaproteobacteria bacterium]